MRLLITGANSPLGRALIAKQSSRSVRAVDARFDNSAPVKDSHTGDLRDPEFVAEIVRGREAIVHLAPLYTRLENDTASLDHATRGTYQLVTAAAAAGVKRFILGSSLDLFSAVSDRYRVDEAWRPRPTPALDDLCVYLAEIGVREVVRVTDLTALCLRFGKVVDDAAVAEKPYDPRWLHIDDALSALRRSLEIKAEELPQRWSIYHIAARGNHVRVPVARAAQEPMSYAPVHDFDDRLASTGDLLGATALPTPIPSRSIHNVVVFGAGGPLGAATATELAESYTLRLTDLLSAAEIRANRPPQSPGAPLPEIPSAPHSWQIVDMRDPEQVMAACEGMDAIVNVSVLRSDPADAWRVNTLGAYHVMQAAIAHGIRRVVHTGPFMLGIRGAAGYNWDYRIVDDVPPRPGTDWVYFPSKLAGQEIVRIFAEHYGLEAPTLTFCQFLNPEVKHYDFLHPLTVSWADSARAIRAALEVGSLPNPYEYFHIGTDLPHDIYTNDKARRLLGWQPRDLFEDYYLR